MSIESVNKKAYVKIIMSSKVVWDSRYTLINTGGTGIYYIWLRKRNKFGGERIEAPSIRISFCDGHTDLLTDTRTDTQKYI